MITTQLTKYTKALNALPDEIKNNLVNMGSLDDPTCGAPGCHAGLISLAAVELQELRECYNKICEMQSIYNEGYPRDFTEYSYTYWADALSLYLGFPFDKIEYTYYGLTRWARDNPYFWGNLDGLGMFSSSKAFGQDKDNFPHSVIIDHFTVMSDRLNENQGK